MIATKATYSVIFAIAVIFGLTALWPAFRLVGIALDITLVVLLILDYQLTPRPRLLSATRELADRLSIGRPNEVTLRIVNSSASKLACRVRDDYPVQLNADVREFEFEIAPGSVSILKYTLMPARRGAYEFGQVNVRYRSFLGFLWREAKISAPRTVKVFSDLKALYDLSIKLSRSSELGELHQRKRGQGTDFSSLKEYTVGDDSKSIDWKATARRDRPVVRTYEAEQEQRLCILIDAGRMMASDLEGLTRFDHALNAALCLALTGLSHND
ncbi:MAG TPA: DUF58 domain-containing protein, partial [Chroococcales cyanobacterium]